MRVISYRAVMIVIGVSLGFFFPLQLDGSFAPTNFALLWDIAARQGVRDTKLAAPPAARALAIVHTCMFDAWAAFDGLANGTQFRDALRRPANERTKANKERAVSYAAYQALVDLLPIDTESVYKPLMKQLGYDPDDHSTDIETPTGIGTVACAAVLEFRHHDKSNQRGDFIPTIEPNAGSAGLKVGAVGPYGDWSGYHVLNPPGTIPARFPVSKPLNPDHWQPLTYTDSTGSIVLQMFVGAQWSFVTPFAMAKGDDFRSAVEPGPFRYGSPEYEQQAEELIAISGSLTDLQKMIAEYWSGEVYDLETIGHWMEVAQFVSSRDQHTLDDDVKMYFALSNALLDASIAAWDAKRAYDSPRPVTAISLLYNGKKIHSWGGPGKGTIEMDGSRWLPYEPRTYPTPPTPEYVSEQSVFSAAAALVLERWTRSEHLGYSVVLPAHSSRIEPGVTPPQAVEFQWTSFSDVVEDAGMSGHYGGIQFPLGDRMGRKLGRIAAEGAWQKAQSYFIGSNPSPVPSRASVAR